MLLKRAIGVIQTLKNNVASTLPPSQHANKTVEPIQIADNTVGLSLGVLVGHVFGMVKGGSVNREPKSFKLSPIQRDTLLPLMSRTTFEMCLLIHWA